MRRRAKLISTRRAKDWDAGLFHTAQITIRDQRSNEELFTSRNRFSVKYAG
jgi:hypothetical protein